MRLFIFLTITCIAVQSSSQDLRDKASELGINGQFGTQIFEGGGGVSFFDFDKDGLEDLTFCSDAGQNVYFFKNNGDSFSPISFVGIYNFWETKQAIWVDFDNDNDYDLFITAFGAPDLLYVNDGNMNFSNETVQRGLGIYYEHSYGADFSDINNDGWLDLYISNYDDLLSPSAANYFYLFDPIDQKYTDISLSSGADNGAQQTFCTVFFDYDFDGDQDFLVSNDRVLYPNALYRNNGDNTFTDVSSILGADIQIWSMNASCGDYNNDGYWDLYHTNITSFPAVLLSGSASGAFTDQAATAKVAFDKFGWAGNFFDYDNDADLDLYVVSSTQSPNAFFVNDGNGIFSEPFVNTSGLNSEDTLNGFSSAIADFDNNGLLDIAVSKNTQPFSLFLNYEGGVHNWIKLDLEGTLSNRDAIGTYLESWISGSKRIFQKSISNGYLNQHSDLIHIGMGAASTIDSIIIRWPFPNSSETIYNLNSNSTYMVKEGSGIVNSYDQGICHSDYNLTISPIPNGTYGSADSLHSASQVYGTNAVIFKAEEEITLKPGFTVDATADFIAEIDECP